MKTSRSIDHTAVRLNSINTIFTAILFHLSAILSSMQPGLAERGLADVKFHIKALPSYLRGYPRLYKWGLRFPRNCWMFLRAYDVLIDRRLNMIADQQIWPLKTRGWQILFIKNCARLRILNTEDLAK